MRTGVKMGTLFLAALAAVLLGIGVGSVYVPPGDILAIVAGRIFHMPLPEHIPANYSVMVLDMRLPRVLLAFLTGAALAVCGGVRRLVLYFHYKPFHSVHELCARRYAAVRPRTAFGIIEPEHQIQPQRVRAVLFYKRVCGNDVAA